MNISVSPENGLIGGVVRPARAAVKAMAERGRLGGGVDVQVILISVSWLLLSHLTVSPLT